MATVVGSYRKVNAVADTPDVNVTGHTSMAAHLFYIIQCRIINTIHFLDTTVEAEDTWWIQRGHMPPKALNLSLPLDVPIPKSKMLSSSRGKPLGPKLNATRKLCYSKDDRAMRAI